MKRIPSSLCLLGLPLLTLVANAAEPRYSLAGTPLEVVTSEAKYLPFAQAVRADADRLLASPTPPSADQLALLLAIRVHLAHHFREDDVALALAARIRDRQTNPADKAFAGLTTKAAVAARRQTGEKPGNPAFGKVFASEFRRFLGELPGTPEIRAMLVVQRDKIAGLTRETLLAETREKISPAIEQRGFCGLPEADQLVRVHHRLTDILPVKPETLRGLEEAIAARSRR